MTNDANIGRRVGDRFVLEELLGTGGMASIYRGRDERLGKTVAIKLLKRALLEDPVLSERFRREGMSLAKLRHPGIVTVLDFGELEGELYTVLELVHGSTLEKLLGETARGTTTAGLSVLRAAPIFDQLLAALELCHAYDIIHRDLKPSNIMISTLGDVDHVTIIDFGLAHVFGVEIDKLTETGTVQGTPHYMAPEQCRGEEVVPATDIYSTGVLFYEVLAGKTPFQAKDAATFMAQHLFVDPQPLDQIAPHVSAGVAAAIHTALAKQPQDRPSARELREALAAAFKGTDPETRASAAASLRKQTAGLSRNERSIGSAAVPGAGAEGGAVILWMAEGARASSLRSSLGIAGLATSLWSKDEPPMNLVGAPRGAIAIVVSARDGSDRIRQLREAHRQLAIVVVDVGSPEETHASIRAGASDMLLSAAPDAELAPKLERLLRRRRARTMS